MEAARARALKQARNVPDEDGFITVTKGGRAGPAKLEEAQAVAEKLKERQKMPEDFYRFQTREKKKENAERLKREFQEDRKRVERMRARRVKIRVCTRALGRARWRAYADMSHSPRVELHIHFATHVRHQLPPSIQLGVQYPPMSSRQPESRCRIVGRKVATLSVAV